VRAEYSSRYELEAERIDDQNVPAEYIVRTDPPAGSEVELGQKIKVYISRGFVVEKKVVPNICGILFDEANKKITALGFAVGDVTFSESEFEKNTVIFQSVTASTEAAVGTEIDIIVSLGPPESETEEEETAEEAPEETAEATAEP
jgi:serine/threonine-protein kinase